MCRFVNPPLVGGKAPFGWVYDADRKLVPAQQRNATARTPQKS
jgi:hypothetical protein